MAFIPVPERSEGRNRGSLEVRSISVLEKGIALMLPAIALRFRARPVRISGEAAGMVDGPRC
jgi:hypothetical protein